MKSMHKLSINGMHGLIKYIQKIMQLDYEYYKELYVYNYHEYCIFTLYAYYV